MNRYKQRIFNRIWNHFMIRKQRISMGNEFNTAMYYGDTGTKCSIGILIPEDIYKPAMEGNDVETVLARWPMLVVSMMERSLLPEDTESAEFEDCVNFMCDMQAWHDSAECHGVTYVYDVGCDAREHLVAIAEDHELCCPPY